MSSKIDLSKAYEKPDKKWRAYLWSPDVSITAMMGQ